jgi:dTDP-4-amino-4,6-dideoxygalactose transaminase
VAALFAEIGPGEEVIMPWFTFVSTPNAFVLHSARPVFVEVRPETLNLDESNVDAAITRRHT